MRRYVAAVVALALGLAPASATVDAGPPTAERRAAVAALRARLAERLPGLHPDLKRSPPADSGFGAVLVRGGDLDGDGAEELVDLRFTAREEPGGGFDQSAAFSVHRGTDGRLLWGRTLPTAAFVFPLVARVGPSGARGILVVSYEYEFAGASPVVAVVDKTTVAAYDAKGAAVWTVSYDAGLVVTPAGFGYATTYVNGLIDAVAGGGDDLLVTTVVASGARLPGAHAAGGTVTPAIVNGATGTARPLTPLAGTTTDFFTTVTGDLDGDRRQDVVVAGGAGPTASFATALKSADGSVLWTAPELPPSAYVGPTGIPDATGDGVGDVLVATAQWSAAPLDTEQDPYVVLVDGKTGALRWKRIGAGGFSLGGDVDRKRGAEIVVGDFVDEEGAFGLRFTAYDAAGKRLWVTTRTLRTDGVRFGLFSAGAEQTGDTDGDRVLDVRYSVRIDGSVSRRDEGTVDGRTGRARRDGTEGMVGVPLPIDGRGTDSVVLRPVRDGVTVTAWRGDARRKLWQVTLKGRVRPWPDVAFADRDRCAELLAGVVRDGAVTHYVLSGATGRPLWALTRSGLAAPRVTRPRVPATRYARTC